MSFAEDRFLIDSHKLMYHPLRVSRWLRGENIFPLYMELSVSRACNHRCVFCAVDYLGYDSEKIQMKGLESFIAEAARRGVKSMMLAGAGEPLLHDDINDIVCMIRQAGIDVAMTTNGVLFTEDRANACLPHMDWIRFSVNAGTAKGYADVHSAKEIDFDAVLNNIQTAVRVRNDKGFACTIGVQLVLLPQNKGDLICLAERLRSIGVDYFSIKPYSQHPKSINNLSGMIDYSELISIADRVESLSTENFKVLFRRNAMQRLNQPKGYKKNYGLSFFSYLDVSGDLYPCIEFSGDKRYVYGNVFESSFKDVWHSSRRQEVVDKIDRDNELDLPHRLTRMEEMNHYLWKLKNPPQHVNFI